MIREWQISKPYVRRRDTELAVVNIERGCEAKSYANRIKTEKAVTSDDLMLLWSKLFRCVVRGIMKD